MSPLELAAALLGLANIVLLVRRSAWNYPFALAMVSLYFWLFLTGKLYSDALLQLFFFVVNVWGWRLWLRAAGQDGTVRVRIMPTALRLRWAAGGIVAWLVWGLGTARFTDDPYPLTDAGIAVASVVAQILLARRYIENWWLWIAVDLVSLPLYALKHYYLTTGLYVLFLMLSIAGLRAWLRAERDA